MMETIFWAGNGYVMAILIGGFVCWVGWQFGDWIDRLFGWGD